MARSHGIIGIDIGTDTVKAILLEIVKGEDLPRVVSVSAIPSEGIILNPEEISECIHKSIGYLTKNTELKYISHFVGIGGTGLEFQKSKGLAAISRADGEVSGEDIKRAVSASESALTKMQNREVLHKIPFVYRVDQDTVTNDPIGLNGNKLEAETFFITSFVHHIRGALKAFDEAKIEIDNIFASPLALSYSVLSKREKEVGVMILDVGATTTSIIVFDEGFPYSMEVIPWGSVNITNDIVKGFQISIEEAEKLKINYGAVASAANTSVSKKDDIVYGAYSKRKLSEIIEARLEDIFELVEKHLKKVDRVGLLPAGVVLVGGGANINGIAEFAKEYLKLPTRVASPENLGGFKDKANNPVWAVSVGVALMALSQNEIKSSIFHGKSGVVLKWLRNFLP